MYDKNHLPKRGILSLLTCDKDAFLDMDFVRQNPMLVTDVDNIILWKNLGVNMKKEKKISLLKECADSKKIARVYFSYDPNYYYFYPNEVSDKYLLAQEENDFQLDGFHIRKISQITKVEIKDDLCSEINVWNGVVNQIHDPNIDISSWHSIFTALQNMNRFIIIEDEINEQFAIGRIMNVCKHHLVFDHFDADGIWQEESLKIPYSSITHVSWNTRYADNWEEFLASRKK